MIHASSGRLIGYARVSTDEQATETQEMELRSAGCSATVQQPGSGASRARPQEAVGLKRRPLSRLTRRSEFLAANAGRRVPMPGFVLLVRPREDGDEAIRVGFTVTKKIGNAVVRNRMKRRFRALARELMPVEGIGGADHVLIGRQSGVERPYATLRDELAKALAKARRR